jgi:hypothetical protein
LFVVQWRGATLRLRVQLFLFCIVNLFVVAPKANRALVIPFWGYYFVEILVSSFQLLLFPEPTRHNWNELYLHATSLRDPFHIRMFISLSLFFVLSRNFFLFFFFHCACSSHS